MINSNKYIYIEFYYSFMYKYFNINNLIIILFLYFIVILTRKKEKKIVYLLQLERLLYI